MQNSALFFQAFYFSYIERSENLELKLLFRCHVDTLPMSSLVRPANPLYSLQRLPEKGYLSQSHKLIFKYLVFDCLAKLSLFP